MPAFKSHMIRQRVDRHGNIFNLEPASELPACNLSPAEIGVIKPGPVRKWMAAKKEWDTKFASSKRKVQKQRAKEIAAGYQQFEGGEVPPPSALAGRRKLGHDLTEEKNKKSMGMSLWSLWGSKHDEKTKVLEEKLDKEPETTVAKPEDGQGARPLEDTKTTEGKHLDAKHITSRSRSRRRTVVDQNQTGSLYIPNENTSAAELLAMKAVVTGEGKDSTTDPLVPDFIKEQNADIPPEILVKAPIVEEYDLKRPKADGIAFPFTLKGHQASASMTTLTSSIGVGPSENVTTRGAVESGIRPDTAASTTTSTRRQSVEEGTSKPIAGNLPSNGITQADPVNHSKPYPEVLNNTKDAGSITQVNSTTEATIIDDDQTPQPSPSQKVIAAGEIFGPGQRPPLETFVTAESHLTLSSAAK